VLPREVVTRSDKAHAPGLFFASESRRFAEAWDGSGADGELVDPAAVRKAWLAGEDSRSALLLQSICFRSIV
jgi:hypothetical protein